MLEQADDDDGRTLYLSMSCSMKASWNWLSLILLCPLLHVAVNLLFLII